MLLRVPSGTSLPGLVKHVAGVEYLWFCHTFGRETELLPFSDDDPELELPIETTQGMLAFYPGARAASDQVIDGAAGDHRPD
ncbi:MAG: hypothetical protein JWO88_2856 [Frankiales bacterium]|nr:hypothetical protein [Frankiales bacterium]